MSPLAQRTGANFEAGGLLLSHAFNLGYRRVECYCVDTNIRLRKAAEKFGFVEEFLMVKFDIARNRSFNAVMYSILDYEWENIKKTNDLVKNLIL